jgi:hypothetical protein
MAANLVELQQELQTECDNFAPPDSSFSTGFPEIPVVFWERVRELSDRMRELLDRGV